MSKTQIVIVAVVIILLVVIGAYFYTKPKKNQLGYVPTTATGYAKPKSMTVY